MASSKNTTVAALEAADAQGSKDCVVITPPGEAIDEAACSKWARSAVTGATSIFIGSTRDHFKGRQVVTLHYEAYETMALKEMQKLCNQIREQWPVEKVCVIHATGEVPVGEVSVLIAVSSPHRRDAIRACEYCIDELKRKVPIWKKEIYAEGDGTWKANCPGCTHDAPQAPTEAPDTYAHDRSQGHGHAHS
eukprot:m.35919 g.35919  ORF g.35919 m.35919 type:complete len:192 (+) comp9942_c0_seq1:146-721(+)